MGGAGTFTLAAAFPELFAAAMPICGGVLFHAGSNFETMTRCRDTAPFALCPHCRRGQDPAFIVLYFHCLRG